MQNLYNKVTQHTASADDQDMRIDRYLQKKLKTPKTHIYKIIRTGQVRINGKRVKINVRIQKNDIIRIPPISDIIETSRTVLSPEDPKYQQHIEQLENAILHEDDALIILNKPAGLPVQAGQQIIYSLDRLLQNFRDTDFIEPVHRIDQPTSGCLIIAKKRLVMQQLKKQFDNLEVEKKYLALCKNKWEQKETIINLALHPASQSGQTIMTIDYSGKLGKHAITTFNVLKQNNHASLCEVTITTGRKHQIRAHAAHAGHPILGDTKYGDPAWNRHTDFQKHLLLHAASISFEHPLTKEKIHITAPRPPIWETAIAKLID